MRHWRKEKRCNPLKKGQRFFPCRFSNAALMRPQPPKRSTAWPGVGGGGGGRSPHGAPSREGDRATERRRGFSSPGSVRLHAPATASDQDLKHLCFTPPLTTHWRSLGTSPSFCQQQNRTKSSVLPGQTPYRSS